ncbi:hypothetical protein JB92DRAFT_3096737 [Gautieria morchelliformis]|nr:hypothetical protein JB92DRAFT_3096737 [Gautieria morchelliformis]
MLLAALGQTPLLNGVDARREKQFVDSNWKRILVSTKRQKLQHKTPLMETASAKFRLTTEAQQTELAPSRQVTKRRKEAGRDFRCSQEPEAEDTWPASNYPPFRAPTLALSTLVITSVGGCPAQRKKTCGIYLANEMKPKVIRVGMVNRGMREWYIVHKEDGRAVAAGRDAEWVQRAGNDKGDSQTGRISTPDSRPRTRRKMLTFFGEGFTMGAAAATVARRNPLTSEVKMTRMGSTSQVMGGYGADEEGGDERWACSCRLRNYNGRQAKTGISRAETVTESDTEGPLQATVCPVGQLGSSERGSSSLTRTMRDSGREPQILGGSISWSPSSKLRRQSKGNRKGPGQCCFVGSNSTCMRCLVEMCSLRDNKDVTAEFSDILGHPADMYDRLSIDAMRVYLETSVGGGLRHEWYADKVKLWKGD